MRCRVRILRNSRGVASGLEEFDASGLENVAALYLDSHLLFQTLHSTIQAPHDSEGPNPKQRWNQPAHMEDCGSEDTLSLWAQGEFPSFLARGSSEAPPHATSTLISILTLLPTISRAFCVHSRLPAHVSRWPGPRTEYFQSIIAPLLSALITRRRRRRGLGIWEAHSLRQFGLGGV